jgi:hypothetical protein
MHALLAMLTEHLHTARESCSLLVCFCSRSKSVSQVKFDICCGWSPAVNDQLVLTNCDLSWELAVHRVVHKQVAHVVQAVVCFTAGAGKYCKNKHDQYDAMRFDRTVYKVVVPKVSPRALHAAQQFDVSCCSALQLRYAAALCSSALCIWNGLCNAQASPHALSTAV